MNSYFSVHRGIRRDAICIRFLFHFDTCASGSLDAAYKAAMECRAKYGARMAVQRRPSADLYRYIPEVGECVSPGAVIDCAKALDIKAEVVEEAAKYEKKFNETNKKIRQWLLAHGALHAEVDDEKLDRVS